MVSYASGVAALAVNILALMIVLGLCWAAMLWLGGNEHGHRRRRGDTDSGEPIERAKPAWIDDPCDACNGMGASPGDGRLEPCRECYGTGVLS